MAEERPGFWSAKWISHSQDPLSDLTPCWFRRRFSVDDPGQPFVIRVSADQRFKLYVNGTLVATGPQRGDLQHWFYDELDISPWLKAGENRIEALVWSFGRYAPMAQISARLAFICDGPGISTPDGWTAAMTTDRGYGMTDWDGEEVYLVVGPSESVELGLEPEPDVIPNVIGPGKEPGSAGGDSPWWLMPRTLPVFCPEPLNSQPQIVDEQTGERRRFAPLTLAEDEEALLDMGALVCGYPQIELAGEGGLRIGYAEALADAEGQKGVRHEVAGKRFHGYYDEASGEGIFEPLWWRTFRYVRLMGLGAGQRVEGFRVQSIGSPFPVAARFDCSDPQTQEMWEVGVRTAHLCAGETYFDCPYYEQLQYAGDTRIQAMIGYYLSSDRARQRTAIDQFAWSRISDGPLQSRYPSRELQVIPGFCLWWVMMLYDQWLYDTEPSPQNLRLAAEQIDLWHERLLADPERSYWTFADWCPEWRWGEPPGRSQALVHRLTLLMAEIAFAKMTGQSLEMLRRQLAKLDPSQDPSEHAVALYRLCEAELRSEEPCPVPLTGTPIQLESVPRCTYYFAFYKHLAEANPDYFSQLGPWREQLRLGLSTFAETPEPTRSDCHAWSAHPLIGFFQQVAGVSSIAPAWSKALIAPRTRGIEWFRAAIPHPQGELTVEWEGGDLKIKSPVPYRLVWQGETSEHPAG